MLIVKVHIFHQNYRFNYIGYSIVRIHKCDFHFIMLSNKQLDGAGFSFYRSEHCLKGIDINTNVIAFLNYSIKTEEYTIFENKD